MSLRRVLRLRCPPPHSPIEAHPNPVSQIQEIQLPGRRSGTTVTTQPRRARVPPAGRRHLSLRIDAGRLRVSHEGTGSLQLAAWTHPFVTLALWELFRRRRLRPTLLFLRLYVVATSPVCPILDNKNSVAHASLKTGAVI